MHKAFWYLIKASMDDTALFFFFWRNNHMLAMETNRSKQNTMKNNTKFFRHMGKLHERDLLKQ
jgi:hypothetical protein